MSVQDPSALGIPQKAIERLRGMAQPQTRFFTSDLSANEFLLVKEAGFDPMGLVVGSSIYHVGWQNKGWNQNQEVQVLSQAIILPRNNSINGAWIILYDPIQQAPSGPAMSFGRVMGEHLGMRRAERGHCFCGLIDVLVGILHSVGWR